MPAAPFTSLIFRGDVSLEDVDAATQPECFHDLNLDQLVDNVCANHQRTNLEHFFWLLPGSIEAIRYRQDALRQAAQPAVREAVTAFAEGFTNVRIGQSEEKHLRYDLQRQRVHLDTALDYCATVKSFAEQLSGVALESEAFDSLRAHVTDYVASDAFGELEADAHRVSAALAQVTYLLQIRANRIRVRHYEEHPDLSREVAELFDRFRETQDRLEQRPRRWTSGFGHVEAAVLGHVAQLFPEQFGLLANFCEKHQRFVERALGRLGREVHFVIAWLDFTDRLDTAGLSTCYPELSTERELQVEDTYDAALAATLEGAPVVTNDVRLEGEDRIIVVTGPNQGGKTTFARAIGQIHYLTALGCPVPGSRARIPVVDRVLAQFERQEIPDSDRGKLKDDLIRMRQLLEAATPQSLVVLNEVFSSTATDDALALAQRVLDRLLDLDCFGVCVTFLDELADDNPRIVSMVAEVDPDDPSVRTFLLNRRPADGKAYAASIARKYGLTPQLIRERVAS